MLSLSLCLSSPLRSLSLFSRLVQCSFAPVAFPLTVLFARSLGLSLSRSRSLALLLFIFICSIVVIDGDGVACCCCCFSLK